MAWGGRGRGSIDPLGCFCAYSTRASGLVGTANRLREAWLLMRRRADAVCIRIGLDNLGWKAGVITMSNRLRRADAVPQDRAGGGTPGGVVQPVRLRCLPPAISIDSDPMQAPSLS